VPSFLMLTAGGTQRPALSLGCKRLMCGNACCNSYLMLLNFSAFGYVSNEDGLHSLLGTFAKLQKATIIFVMSVRLSAWNNSAPTGQIFMKFDI